MKPHLLIISILLLQSCTQDEGSPVTELEGTWSTICIPSFTFFNNPVGENHKIVTTYQGNNIITVVDTYSDTSCSQLESTIEASQSTLFANPDDVQVSFTIGNSITSSNGVPVKEIDFLTVGNETQLNIYLLQDNGNTLYFGIPCTISPATCINERATEISYLNMYTKVN